MKLLKAYHYSYRSLEEKILRETLVVEAQLEKLHIDKTLYGAVLAREHTWYFLF